MSIVLSDYFMEQVLSDILDNTTSGTFAGILEPAKMVLWTNNVLPTHTNVLADLGVATSPGIVATVATFSGPYRRSLGGFGTQSALVKFAMSDSTQPFGAYGYAVTDGQSSAKLLFCERFLGAPLLFNDTFDSVGVSAEFVIGGPDYGTAIVEH